MTKPAAPTPEAIRTFVTTDPLCLRLAEVAARHGRSMAFVGGCVRDWLMGREPLDWDLVVPGDPTPLVEDLTRAVGGPVVTLDAEFGVVRTKLKSGLTIDVVRQHGERLEDDLGRRDLTINAIACPLAEGCLCDPFHGMADLQAGVVRAVAEANLDDDPLRMLRVFRFAATLDFAIAPDTLGWVHALAPKIATSAGERVNAELAKLLGSPHATRLMPVMASSGLLGALLPEVSGDLTQWPVQRFAWLDAAFDALGHHPEGERLRDALAQPLTETRARVYLVRLAALLCPPGHLSAVRETVAARLHLSKKEANWLAALDQARSAIAPAPDVPPRLAHFRLKRDFGDAVLGALLLALADRAVTPGSLEGARALLGDYWRWEERPLPRLLGGGELQTALGLKPGPHFAPLLRALEEAQALGEVATREEALAWAATYLQARE